MRSEYPRSDTSRLMGDLETFDTFDEHRCRNRHQRRTIRAAGHLMDAWILLLVFAIAASQGQSHMYCSEQINIPATLPGILKCYAKAAIRTQPSDLLYWTAAYFRALADGELPPVKKRLEYPPYDHPTGISPGFLKSLLNQFTGEKENGQAAGTTERTATSMCVTLGSLLARWRGMALSDSSLWQILMTGRLLELPGAPGECDLYRFLAIACGLMGNNLFETMIHVCELLTDEPEGGSAMIPRKTFMSLYEYLADLDCSGGQSIIGTGPAGVATAPKRDEASLVRSNFSSSSCSSSASSYGSGFSTGDSSAEKKTRVELCRGIDTSTEDTDSEECLSRTEVSSREKYREQLARPDEGGTEVRRCITRDSEERASGRASFRRRSDSTGDRTSAKATGETKSPRSEKSTNDDKKRCGRRVPEGKAEEPGGSETEVTRVQEVRRRRLDVEMHSRTEEVKPVAGETTAELPPPLLDSPRSRVAVSSSPGKSHVVAGEGVKAPDDDDETAADVPRENTNLQRNDEFDRTDKILATRSLQLRKEVGGDRHAASQRAASGIGVRDNANGSTTARGDVVKKIRRKIRDESKRRVARKVRRADEEEIPRDSFEYEHPTDNGGKVERRRKSSTKPEKESSEKGITERAADPGDYVSGESYDGNGSEGGYEDVDDEEVEDMAKYETIGLENVLKGICECLDSTKETRGGSSVAASSASPLLDPVVEFVERMKAEDPTGPYVLPEVPGIGPPVSNARVTAVGLWLAECSRRQQGHVGPRNLRHFLCPNLDEKSSQNYCSGSKIMCPRS